ncbi:hypothetical protein D6D19_06586 [Aureobasidium pullulans]|uniref:BTB domain-containing protein n=1 Tax=Aureobasidium pullulans TaxID=5580 RepID=A0A4V4IR40_AURPU|nr:hypothetical protein D6D19_06586 [Aureobasidium pullulans]
MNSRRTFSEVEESGFADPRFVQGECASDDSVLNNPQYSDLIITFGQERVYAHGVVLCMWSLYSKRCLIPPFSADKTAVLHLGNDNDPHLIYNLLKHIYGLSYGEPHNEPRDVSHENPVTALEQSANVYTVAERYDCPSLRRAAILVLRSQLSKPDFLRNGGLEPLISLVSRVCGPNSVQTMDPTLRHALVDWVGKNYKACIRVDGFRIPMGREELFDLECANRLLQHFS